METLRNLILAEHNKAQALLIADIVYQKPELLNDLLTYTFANEEPLSRRASWPLRILHQQHPELLKKHIPDLINELENIGSSAVLRNILAVLVRAELPETKKSYLLDFSAKAILNPKSPVAIIAYASDLFIKIAENEMSLLQELHLMLEQIKPNSTGGIESKINQLNHILRNS